MWAKGRRHGRASPKGLDLGLWGSATALFLVVTLSSAAFLLPQAQLPWLAAINLILVVHGMLQRGAIGGVIRFVLLQLGFTLGLYALMHGASSWDKAPWRWSVSPWRCCRDGAIGYRAPGADWGGVMPGHAG